MPERVLPHSLEAERAVLGKLLLKPVQIADVVDELQSCDFFRGAHADLYEHVVDLWKSGTDVDPVTLRDALRKSGKLDTVGGPAYLAGLTEGMPHQGLTAHVEIVREKAKLRRLIAKAQELTDRGYAEEGADDLLEDAEQRIREIAQRGAGGGFIDGPTLAARVYSSIQTWHSTDGPSGLLTGFTDLDEATTGLQAGDFALLAGRPSMGKSQFAGQVAYHVAARQRCPVAYFSLEMDVESIGVRMVCAEARLDLHAARRGWLRDHDMRRFTEGLKPIEEGALFLDEGMTVRVADIRRKVRHLQVQHGLSLIVIDYLQLLDASLKSRGSNRNEDISEISRAVKTLARELKVPVLALSQLSRRCEQRPDKRPMLSDLRESGALEQDADLVMFLYRDEVYQKTAENAGQAELIIAKQRNGPLETVALHWTPNCVRFDAVERFAA